MAWCRQATSHYLSQCWTRSMASLGLNELKGLKIKMISIVVCRIYQYDDIYTSNQFYGIILPTLLFCIKAGWNLSVSEEIHWRNIKDLLQPSDEVLLLAITCILSKSDFLWGMLISTVAWRAICHICVEHIQLWAVAVFKLPSETKVVSILTNTWPRARP